MSEEIRTLDWVDDADISTWLENTSESQPVIFPLWPQDFPEFAPVAMDFEGNLMVALSHRAMLRARDPSRLWFCRVRATDLINVTDADPSWFSLEDDNHAGPVQG